MRAGQMARAVLLCAVVVVIGAIDYATGPDIAFSLFYLIPVGWAGWTMSRRSAAMLAVIASLAWLWADVRWHGLDAVSLWNGFTRLGIFVAVGLLIARVRLDQQQMRDLNRQLQELLSHEQQLARTDALTGLANRRLFHDALRRSLAQSRRDGAPMSVALVDLKGFKQVNDRLGHAAGDEVLRRVASVLTRHVRESDVVARLGGDEFAMLLGECTEAAARSTMARVLDHVRAEFADFTDAPVGASIGVACFDVAPDAPELVLNRADAAMYRAKAMGSSEIVVTSALAPAEASGPPPSA